MTIALSITNQTRTRIDGRWLSRQLRGVLKWLRLRRGEWSITLVGDRAMAALHKRTMHLASTTDVLTFDLGEGGDLELDTVICVDEARRRAREFGHPLRAEVLLYALHSLLHAQGYDDITAAQARRMHRREDEILLRSGVGAVFAGNVRLLSRPGGKRRLRARGKASSRDGHS